LKAIQACLEAEGFYPNMPLDQCHHPRFSGVLVVDEFLVKLELRFNRDHYDYPEAYLLDWPYDTELRAKLGSRGIRSDGKVCHTDESQTWWDCGQAAALTAGVLFKIQDLLRGNLAGDKGYDLVFRDFEGYWSGSTTLRLTDTAANKKVFSHVVDQAKRSWLIPKGGDNDWLPFQPADTDKHCDWVTIHLSSLPYPLEAEWPPQNYRQLEAWLRFSEPGCMTKILDVLRPVLFPAKKKRVINTEKTVGVLFTWCGIGGQEVLGCGFTLTLDKVALIALSQGRVSNVPSLLAQRNSAITRYSVKPSDPAYIQKRNLPAEGDTLKNKRVVMVGAGAIGGFLSELLCGMGAGSGKRGSFEIIDPDIFGPENIGRHLLGFESIDQYKVAALQSRLNTSYPFLRIEGHAADLSSKTDLLTKADWVIDATGSQTVAIAVAELVSQRVKPPITVHGWIQGRGLATVAMIKRDASDACYRCLWSLSNSQYVHRYPLAKNLADDEPVIVGCHKSYHPYVGSTAMLAASQVAQLVQAQLSGGVHQTLQFNIVQPDRCQNRPNSQPSPAKECPFCQHH